MILSAGDPADPEALEALCRAYWRPLYTYVRRRGQSPHDAQDLTQEFFARLLAKNWVAQADRAKGRFRTFLLTAMDRFLANEWDRVRALKRGGGRPTLALDFADAETRFEVGIRRDATPEQAFERRWAITLLAQALGRLESEQQAEGHAALFAALKPSLAGDGAVLPYQELADQLGMTAGAVKAAAHRLRLRYRELLRAEIADTVATAGEIDAEMQHLFKVLAG